MSGRDFDIPMGPDRTGRFNIPEVAPGSGTPADQASASGADLTGLDVAVTSAEEHPVDTWLSRPMDAVPEPIEADGAPVAGAPASAGVSDAPAASAAGAINATEAVEDTVEDVVEETAEPVDEQSRTDVAASLAAFRDSIDQGRELKAREKDREDLADKIHADREELADRDDILKNYAAIVGEQDRIIDQSTYERDMRKQELSQVVAQTEETTEALSRMRDYNDVQLQPYETALGRAQASADQAKNDERSRKSELNAAESEVRRAEKDGDATTERARLDVVQAAYDEAVARSNAAKEALAEAQRNYDNLREQVEQAEAPLENALDDLEKRTDELKDEIARLGDTISAASKRRQYCDTVYQYPDETEKLRNSVAADQKALLQLDMENDDLRERLAESKAKSFKAKALIAFVIVLVIVLICLFWFLSSR